MTTSMYAEIIREAIAASGRPDWADEETAAVVEEIIRTNLTGLDHMSREDLTDETWQIASILDSTFIQAYCEAMELDVPSWAS